MATYNPGHGGGGGGTTAAHHHNAAVPAVAAGGGPSHGLPLAGASIHGNGAVSMDVFDQELNFDESLLDSVNGLAPLPFTPSYEFEGFNTFEDPFSYSTRPAYDVPGTDAEPFNEESPSQELDNKLLGFSAPLVKAQLVDAAGNFAETNMSAELYGMFFVAEDVFGGENTGRPLELTCYRRNLWQCSGQITLPRHLSHLIDEQGQQVPIIELAASITAMESIEGKPTEIISIPWKSSSATSSAATVMPSVVNNSDDSKSPTAPPRLALDLSTGQELDHNRVSLPVSWKRLQFKHATANNGRRKGLQQHYVVQINLLSKTKTGEFAKIAEIQSGPVIVRGRSPRNFDSRKDVPLSAGDKKTERRSTTSSSAAEVATPAGPPGSTMFLKTEKGTDLAQNIQKYHSLGNVQQSGDWATPSTSSPYSSSSQHPSKKLAVSPNLSRPPVPSWSSTSLDTPSSHNNSRNSIPATPVTPRSNSFQRSAQLSQQQQHNTTTTTLPINLSLSEDERSPNRSTTDSVSPRFPNASHVLANSSGNSNSKHHLGSSHQRGGGNTGDDEEQLYEYFPLTVDDWMPPVDAIYRPHVVHHTIVPPELKAQQVRSRTKRYFSSD